MAVPRHQVANRLHIGAEAPRHVLWFHSWFDTRAVRRVELITKRRDLLELELANQYASPCEYW